MSRWFRFYDDVVNDPKVLSLPEALRWHWVALLCVASKNDGTLPAVSHLEIVLRLSKSKVAAILTQLFSAGLLDKNGDVFSPHNWEGRQFKSDKSNDRVKRHRGARRNVTCNVTDTVTVTPPEQNRAETEQSRADARDVSRETDLQKQIVKAFEAANSPNLPDTTRCALWLSQGYDPAIIASVVGEIVKKKPSISSLNYFDTPIKEAHAVKAEPKQTYVGRPEKLDIETAVRVFAQTGNWSKHAPCGEPGQSGCTATPELLAKYGLAPDGTKLRAHQH